MATLSSSVVNHTRIAPSLVEQIREEQGECLESETLPALLPDR